jgi:TetR/AcrR family transcriptional regulator
MVTAKKDKPNPTTRKERERLEHRRQILESAERVFVCKGYHTATVDEIARDAEFAAGTIYNFFESKEDLYIRVIEKVVREFIDLFESAVAAKKTPTEAIAALIRLKLTHFEAHRGFFRVLFETSPASRVDPSEMFHRNCADWRNKYITTVSEIFKCGIKNGEFHDLDPLYMTLCFEGIMHAFMSYWSWQEPDEPLDVRIEKLTETFVGRIRIEPGSAPRPTKKAGGTTPKRKK